MADKKGIPGYVEFGSAEHRALLGIDRVRDPEERAKLEEQLKTRPEAVSKRQPVKLSVPTTREGEGEEIIDGWRRRGE